MERKIYQDFILEKRQAPPPDGEYVEVHHIVPRCLGGGNDTDNLIPLLPEDHFLAHYLLAQVEGGKCIGALRIMASRAYGKKRVKFKEIRSDVVNVSKLYADAKRLLNKEFRGDATPSFDSRIFSFVHEDGSEETCTKNKLCNKYNIDVRNLSNVVHGKRNSVNGWTTKEKYKSDGFSFGLPSGCRHSNTDKKIYRFKNKNGDVYEGMRIDFCREKGVCENSVKELVKQRLYQTNGWYLADRFDSFPTKRFIYDLKAKRYELKNIDGGVAHGTRLDLQKVVGCTSGEISNLINGKMKSARGWMLPGTDPQTINATGKPPIKVSKIYGTVYHKDKGEFTGNGTEFRQKMEPYKKRATEAFGELMRGSEKSWYGWRVKV